MPFGELMNHESVVYLHPGRLFSHKKHEALSFATRMELEIVLLSETNRTHKYHILTHVQKIASWPCRHMEQEGGH
jgi:hypothetical protein